MATSACATSGASGRRSRPAEPVAAPTFHGRSASDLVERFGEPGTVRRVAPGLLLYEWYQRGGVDPGYPDPGLETKAGFFVRPNGTVIGPACAIDSMFMTNVDEIVAILGPPTRLRRYRHFDQYTWCPEKPKHGRTAQPGTSVVEMRLALSVDKYGYITGWS